MICRRVCGGAGLAPAAGWVLSWPGGRCRPTRAATGRCFASPSGTRGLTRAGHGRGGVSVV